MNQSKTFEIDTQPKSKLTGKPLSQDQLDHLEEARKLAVISRRKSQLTRVESKAAELKEFLGVGAGSDSNELCQSLNRWAQAISDLEDRHRSKLHAVVQNQTEVLKSLQSDVRRLSGDGSVVSSSTGSLRTLPRAAI